MILRQIRFADKSHRPRFLPPDRASIRCPECGAATVRSHVTNWCVGCHAGWQRPVDYGIARGLRPSEVMREIRGRRSWHSRGTPLIRVKGGSR